MLVTSADADPSGSPATGPDPMKTPRTWLLHRRSWSAPKRLHDQLAQRRDPRGRHTKRAGTYCDTPRVWRANTVSHDLGRVGRWARLRRHPSTMSCETAQCDTSNAFGTSRLPGRSPTPRPAPAPRSAQSTHTGQILDGRARRRTSTGGFIRPQHALLPAPDGHPPRQPLRTSWDPRPGLGPRPGAAPASTGPGAHNCDTAAGSLRPPVFNAPRPTRARMHHLRL
jgi:hypothetical protein